MEKKEYSNTLSGIEGHLTLCVSKGIVQVYLSPIRLADWKGWEDVRSSDHKMGWAFQPRRLYFNRRVPM